MLSGWMLACAIRPSLLAARNLVRHVHKSAKELGASTQDVPLASVVVALAAAHDAHCLDFLAATLLPAKKRGTRVELRQNISTIEPADLTRHWQVTRAQSSHLCALEWLRSLLTRLQKKSPRDSHSWRTKAKVLFFCSIDKQLGADHQ